MPTSPESNDPRPDLVVTVHPSSILRGPPEARDESFAGLVADLRFAASLLDATV